jgi:hypothetical protein
MSGPTPEALVAAVYRKLLAVPSRIATRGALAITKLWRAAYVAGRSPDGQRWPALAASTVRRKGHALILRDSDETLGATRAVPARGSGILLQTGPNAAWHMKPTANRPQRRVLPLRLPAEWMRALARIADDENRKATS